MRIIVCFKQVPDTSARLRVEPGSLEPHRAGLLPVVNPYDEFALEEALRLRDSGHEAEIILLTLVAEAVDESIFHGLAMGADRAIVLRLPAGTASAPLVTTRILAAEIEPLRPDLIFCGERAVDDDAAQVGPGLAEMLNLPQICGAERAEVDETGRMIRARCRRPSAGEVFTSDLPCLVSFVRGESLPRYPSLDDVFNAGDKPVETREITPADAEPPQRVALLAPRETRAGRTIEGEPEDAVEQLLSDPDGMVSFL